MLRNRFAQKWMAATISDVLDYLIYIYRTGRFNRWVVLHQ